MNKIQFENERELLSFVKNDFVRDNVQYYFTQPFCGLMIDDTSETTVEKVYVALEEQYFKIP